MSMHSATIVSKVLLALLILLLLLMMINCSAGKRYKILKVFFDGVPEPGSQEKKKQEEAAKAAARTQTPAARETWIKMKSRHPDYAENNCNNCHNRSAVNFLKTPVKELCFTCHKEAAFQGKYVHGPVASRACLTCHQPHESRYTSLLNVKDDSLCFQCHNKNHLASNSMHPPAGKIPCFQCHDPHASDNRFFLKLQTE